jgi:hypothetical protein
MNLAAALLLATLLPGPRDEESVSLEVRDGRTQGVLLGFSVVLVGGNALREVWTLRPDGILLCSAPEGSFEDFLKRDLTAEEKKQAGRYVIKGKQIQFNRPRSETEENEITYNAAGRLTSFKAGAKIFFAIRPGVDFPLVGYFSTTNSLTTSDGKMTTMAYTNYSFFPGGFFSTESGMANFGRMMETKTRESSRTTGGGIEFTTETFQQETSRFYGGGAKSRAGRFELKGSGLVLRFDDGKVQTRFIATVGSSKDRPVSIVIDGASYKGSPGSYGGEGAASAPATPSLAVCAHDLFEIRTPEGMSAAELLQDGQKQFTLAPSPADPAYRYSVVAYEVTLSDKSLKADAPGFAAEVRVHAGRSLGKELEEAGTAVPVTIDGTKGLRVPLKTEFNGVPLRYDGVLVLKDGRGLFLAGIGNEEGAKRHETALATVLQAVRFKSTGPVVKVSAVGLDFELPEKWTTKVVEQDAAKMVVLLPPGEVFAPDKNQYLFAFTVEPSTLKSAADAEAIQKLRDQIQQLAPGLEKQGEPEKLTVDGEPAVGLHYAAKNDAGVTIVLRAYAVVKGGREAALVVLGPDAAFQPHAAALRRAFESLRLK